MTLDLTQLNERQREAVLHGTGPLLVLAGAGSGKTSTMAYRIAHLIAARGVSPSNILGLSFTRKAAAELKERVLKLSGGRRGVAISTFHSLCVQMLRGHAQHLGYQTHFTILDQTDQRDLVKQILRQIKLDDRRFDSDFIGFEIGQAKNRFLSGDAARAFFLESGRLPPDYAIAATSVYERYQEQLLMRNAMDFDDLLFNAVRLLDQVPALREFYSKKFRHILVDEYQDTNPAQFRLLELLTSTHQNITVVGDDDQSIYGWRGADSAHILEFSHHFKGARIITLDQNYRSTNIILEAANEVIRRNPKRHPKRLWSSRGQGEPIQLIALEDDRAEAEHVAEEILRRAKEQNRPWKDFAILYRSNPQSRVFEEALRVRQIPYRLVGSLSFLDRKEIKDTLSYFRLVLNPKDEASMRRILNWPARGIGKGTIDQVHAHAVAHGVTFYEALKEIHQDLPRGREAAQKLLELLQRLRMELEAAPGDAAGLATWARWALDQIGVKQALFDEYEEDPAQAQKRWDIVEELCHGMGQMDLAELPEPRTGVGLLTEYIARMTLNALDDEDRKERKDGKDGADQVILLTLHGAKGLEYPVVFLVGMEDGLLPHQRTIDEAQDLSEERRLCYVGITRARDHLILTRAKNRIRYGKPVPRTPSRFLAEVPENLVLTQDHSLTPDLSTREKREAHETRVKSFLDQIRAQISGGKLS